jgi:eukaryotic-like serine/threonine-protein kinase
MHQQTVPAAHKMALARIVVITLAALVLALGAFWLVKRSRDARWARTVALPEISRLYDTGRLNDAYALAAKIENLVPDDPALAKVWPQISYRISIETTPPGADVYRSVYGDANAPWQFVGRTPVKEVRAPQGYYVWKIEKAGFGTVLRTTLGLFGLWVPSSPGRSNQTAIVALDESGKIPSGMVKVSTAKNYAKELIIPGYEALPEIDLKDFWIDQYEVTNRQFRAFVDQVDTRSVNTGNKSYAEMEKRSTGNKP